MWGLSKGRRSSSVCSLIKDAQMQTRSTSPTRTRQWNEPWRELSVEMFELCRGQEGDVCVCVHACVCAQLCWGLLSENETSLPTLSAAPGLSLCDANCFCYSCQVPTLPQHILQTGPGPSADLCVCLRSKFKKKKAKQKDVFAICNDCATAPHTPQLRHIFTVSQNCGGKTNLTTTTANKTQNNSRGSCFDSEVNSKDTRRCRLLAFVRH